MTGAFRITRRGAAAAGLIWVTIVACAACGSTPLAGGSSSPTGTVPGNGPAPVSGVGTGATAGTPTAGAAASTPFTGTPATGTPSTGTPSTGTPRGTPATSTPRGTPATALTTRRTALPAPAARQAGPAALEALAFPLFPASNAWNARVDAAAVDPGSATLVSSIGAAAHLHPDFGADLGGGVAFGIPYVVVPGTQRRVPVSFDYAAESDPGPYPIPADAPIEGGPSAGGDRHVLVVDRDHRRLYELFDAHPLPGGAWHAASGAVFDLASNTARPAGWTSADAAGLPVLPGLVRYDEVAAGHIDHALRFTVARTRRGYVAPARHFASGNAGAALPPMGMRVRLKASFDVSGYPTQARVILQALKAYGMIVADNGSNWFISGTPDRRWNDDALNTLKAVPGGAFEVVAMGPVTTASG